MPLLEWNYYPSVVIGVICFDALYLCAVGPLRKKIASSQPINIRIAINFLLGSLVLFLALVSPLDALSDEYLFSAHMIQHTLMTLVVPPLLLAGIPDWMFELIVSNRIVRMIARLVTNPLIAFSLYNLVFSIWHLPVIYEAALENEALHIIEHLSFISTAVLFWWPILSKSISVPHLAYPSQILYLFLASVPCTILGGVLSFRTISSLSEICHSPPRIPWLHTDDGPTGRCGDHGHGWDAGLPGIYWKSVLYLVQSAISPEINFRITVVISSETTFDCNSLCIGRLVYPEIVLLGDLQFVNCPSQLVLSLDHPPGQYYRSRPNNWDPHRRLDLE